MNRKAEKLFLRLCASWNILAAILTIFGYSFWFKEKGVDTLTQEGKLNYATSSMVDNIVRVAAIFGLFMLAIGVVNLYVAKFLEKELVDKKIVIWMIVCVTISFLSFDVIAILFYLVATILYCARTRAYKKTLAHS